MFRPRLPPQDEVRPTRCYPGFRQARRQIHFSTCCTTCASPAAAGRGQGPPSLRSTAPRRAGAVQACPTGPHTLPTARAAARDIGKGVGPRGIGCYTSFPCLSFQQAPSTTGTKSCYSSIIALLLPTHSLWHAFSTAN